MVFGSTSTYFLDFRFSANSGIIALNTFFSFYLLYMCVRVCIYVSVSLYIYVCVCVYIYIYIYIYIYVCMCLLYIYMCVSVFMYAYIYLHMFESFGRMSCVHQWSWRPGFNLRSSHTKDSKNSTPCLTLSIIG